MRNDGRCLSRLFVLAAGILLGACAALGGVDWAEACQPGSHCEFHGKLTFFPGDPVPTVLVERGKTCVKLALSDDDSRNLSAWDGKHVFVSGIAFNQFYDPGLAMLWYSFRDRKLGVGVCDYGDGLYVESIAIDH